MGRPKQMLQVGGFSLLDGVLKESLISELDRVILVLGYRAQEIKGGLKTDLHHPKLQIIENRNYRDGISSSIIAGLSEVEDDYERVMIILADMPHITSKIINLLLHEYLASGLPLGALKIKGRRSHPVIFDRSFYGKLHQLRGDMGARELFLKFPDQVCLVEPKEDMNDIDIDTMKDYLDFKRSRIK